MRSPSLLSFVRFLLQIQSPSCVSGNQLLAFPSEIWIWSQAREREREEPRPEPRGTHLQTRQSTSVSTRRQEYGGWSDDTSAPTARLLTATAAPLLAQQAPQSPLQPEPFLGSGSSRSQIAARDPKREEEEGNEEENEEGNE